MNLNHLTFLSDIIMHHNNISNFNLHTTSMGETWENTLFRECLMFPQVGGSVCLWYFLPWQLKTEVGPLSFSSS